LEDRTTPSILVVTTTSDASVPGQLSLRQAINVANAGGAGAAPTITFAPGLSGTITLTSGETGGELHITHDVTISGPGAGVLAVSGNQATRVFDIDAGVTAAISGLTIENGTSTGSGGGIFNLGTLTVSNSTLSNNSAGLDGGAVASESGATLDLAGCTFGNNVALGQGGALVTGFNTTTQISDCSFLNNTGGDGGAIHNDTTLTVTGSTFSGNAASGTTQTNSGGGIINFGTATISDSTFTSNSAAADGGAIANYAALTLNQDVLTGNTATAGGNGGGAVLSSGGNTLLTIDRCTLSNNTAAWTGGAISLIDGGTLTLTNSTVSGNTSSRDGGGITVQSITADVTATVVNSTITGNTAENYTGGGILNFGYGSGTSASLVLQDCTINGNSAPGGGGGVSSSVNSGTATTSYIDTLFAANTNGNVGTFAGGTAISLGHNLSDDGTGNLTAPGDIPHTNPLLGGLQDNGGPTLTQALLTGSPAIGAGVAIDGITTDQRGMPRPASNPDIGAFQTTPRPAVSTRAGASAGGVVGSALLSDTATLTGGVNPGGKITFTLDQPDGTTVTVGTVQVNGDGTYNSPTVLSTEVGTYTWHAAYGGDPNNLPAKDNGANEAVPIVKASPTITTQAGGTGTMIGSVLTDTATLSGGYNVNGGVITFTLTAPDGSTAATETVTVTGGDGTYSTPTGVTATQAGKYTWSASYGGNSTNNRATDDGTNESWVVSPFVVVANGPPDATVGDNITYTLTLTNEGSDTAQNVVLTDAIPAGATFVSATQQTSSGPVFTLTLPPVGSSTGTFTAQAASLPVGQSVTFVLVLQPTGTTSDVTNVATVAATGGNLGPATVTVGTHVKIRVTLTLSAATVVDGSPPDTLVGTVSAVTAVAGSRSPLTVTPDNPNFFLVLTRTVLINPYTAEQEYDLLTNFAASLATDPSYLVNFQATPAKDYAGQATYQVTVVPPNSPPQGPPTPAPPGPPAPSGYAIELVRVRVGGKTRMKVVVQNVATGAENSFLSPFQPPAYKNFSLVARPGFPNQFVLTARKGGRTFRRIFSAV
jgi:uncharacterized repeat protein (TIGR01451 family)